MKFQYSCFTFSKQYGICSFFLTWVAFALLLIASSLYGQSDSLGVLLPELNDDDDDGSSELFYYYKSNPVRVNEANRGQLLDIPFMPQWAADSILAWRERNGEVDGRRTLRAILGDEYYGLLGDLLDTRPARPLRRQVVQRQTYKIEKIPQIEDGRYAGDAFYSYTRLNFEWNRQWSLAAIAQKDPGEESYTDHFNFALEGDLKNWRIIAGDYNVQWASGLVMGGSFGRRKSLLPSYSLRFRGVRARPHISSSENAGKRGIYLGGTLPLNIELHLFAARTARDVRFEGDTPVSLRNDGYHRSANEISGYRGIDETLLGVAATARLGKVDFGLLWDSYSYNRSFEARPPVISENAWRRQRFAFNGNRAQHISFFYSAGLGPLQWSGEAAIDHNGSPALFQSLLLRKEAWQAGLLFTHLDKKWQAADGNLFDSSSDAPQGAQALYATLRFRPIRQVTISGYRLLEKEIWRSFFDELPMQQSDGMVQVDWKLNKNELSARWRQKQSQIFTEQNGPQQRVQPLQNEWRVEGRFVLSRDVQLRSRWQHTQISHYREKGTLLFQDVRFRAARDTEISTRLTLFKTDSYSSRIYEYEHDLPGSFANRAMYGNGYKFYIRVRQTLYENIDVWLKWRYQAREASGRYGTTRYDLDRELRAQLAWNF